MDKGQAGPGSKGGAPPSEEGLIEFYNTAVVGLEIVWDAAVAGDTQAVSSLREIAEGIVARAGVINDCKPQLFVEDIG